MYKCIFFMFQTLPYIGFCTLFELGKTSRQHRFFAAFSFLTHSIFCNSLFSFAFSLFYFTLTQVASNVASNNKNKCPLSYLFFLFFRVTVKCAIK